MFSGEKINFTEVCLLVRKLIKSVRSEQHCTDSQTSSEQTPMGPTR